MENKKPDIKTKIMGEHYVFYTDNLKKYQIINKKDGRIYDEVFVPMHKLDNFDLEVIKRDEKQ